MAKTYLFNFKRLDAYQAAVEHYAWVVEVLRRATALPFSVRDQMMDAALSSMANIAEANGRDRKPGEAEQHYRYAQGSTYESAAYLDALATMNIIDDDTYNQREENLARISSMLHALTQRHSRRRDRS